MKLKCIVFAGIIGLLLFPASADDYLHVRTSAGWTVFNLNSADKLTFTGGKMVVADASGNTVGSFNQADLVNAHVSDSPESTAISQVVAEETPAFIFDQKSQTVKMLKDGKFEIFSVDGRALVSIPETKKGETVSVGALQQGIVIMKSGNYTIKTTVK